MESNKNGKFSTRDSFLAGVQYYKNISMLRKLDTRADVLENRAE